MTDLSVDMGVVITADNDWRRRRSASSSSVFAAATLSSCMCYCSKEYDRVAQHGIQMWKYYRYGLINEYINKPTLPPPLIVIGLLWRVIVQIHRKYKLG